MPTRNDNTALPASAATAGAATPSAATPTNVHEDSRGHDAHDGWSPTDTAGEPDDVFELPDLATMHEVTHPIRGTILRRLRHPHTVAEVAAAMNARDLRARGLAPQARAPRRSGTAAGATGPRAVPFAGRWAIEAWRAPAPVAAPAASIARVALMVQFASSLPRCAIRPRLPRIRAALRAESRGCCGS